MQRELDKYGLKPLKRKNAVKLLQHIYEELHPMVTDSESSFQDTPERPAPPDTTSSDSDGASDLAEESLLVAAEAPQTRFPLGRSNCHWASKEITS